MRSLAAGVCAVLIVAAATPAPAADKCDMVKIRLWMNGEARWFAEGEQIEVGPGREAQVYIHVDSRSASPYLTVAELGDPAKLDIPGRWSGSEKTISIASQSAEDRDKGRVGFKTERAGIGRIGYRILSLPKGQLESVPAGCREGVVRIHVPGRAGDDHSQGDGKGDHPGGGPGVAPGGGPGVAPDQAALCQDAVRQKLNFDRPGRPAVEFDSASVARISDRDSRVTGGGAVMTAGRREPISYDCTVNDSRAEVTLANYRYTALETHDPVHVCQDAVRARAATERGTSAAVSFLTAERYRVSDTQEGVRGNSEVVGKYREPMTYDCRVDVRTGALVSSSWAPAAAASIERVRCMSDRNAYRYCPADTSGGVKVAERISRAECVEGRTWGYDGGGVWVNDGCSAEFEIRPALGAAVVLCESRDNRYQHCRADTTQGVAIGRQLSESICQLNRSWGVDDTGIWVNDGCRAEFRVLKR